jgi:hypothetical protein
MPQPVFFAVFDKIDINR